MSQRREFRTALALCGVGAAFVLLASGRTWVNATADLPRPLPDAGYALTGQELAPAAAAVGLAGLAALAGLIAVRGYARIAVGAVLLVSGAAAAYTSVRGVAEAAVHQALEGEDVVVHGGTIATSPSGWWIVSLVGGVLLVVAGALTAVRGHSWPGLSRKYEAPAGTGGAAPLSDAPRLATQTEDMWASLDHGHDPTVY